MTDKIIQIVPPDNPGKITGGRFAAVLGLSPYKTPFQAWCDMCMKYKKMAHKETPERLAGRLLEPRIADYLRAGAVYGMDIKKASEITGEEMPDREAIDMFPQNSVFGGVFDYIGHGYIREPIETGNMHYNIPVYNYEYIKDGYILEIKTTGKQDFTVPIYYQLQGALYAWLCGFDTVIISTTYVPKNNLPVKMKNSWDTVQTETYTLSTKNTKIFKFNISEYFPEFEKRYIQPAIEFWESHVKTGISPEYDIKKDGAYLEMLNAYATN